MNELETMIKSVNTVLKSWAPLFVDREDKYTNEQRGAVLQLLSHGSSVYVWDFPFNGDSRPVYTKVNESMCPFDGRIEYSSYGVPVCNFEHKWEYAQALMQLTFQTRIYSRKADTCMDRLVKFVTRISTLGSGQVRALTPRMSSRYGTVGLNRVDLRDMGLEEVTPIEWVWDAEKLDVDDRLAYNSYISNLRVSDDDASAGYCLLLPNQEERITLRFDYLKLGRAIKRCLPNASDEFVKETTNSTIPGEVTICTDYDSWYDAYVDCPDWDSCMHAVQYEDVYAFEVYVDSPDAAIARLYSVSGKVIARAVVNAVKMEFESVYGNSRLKSRLVKLGYTRTSDFTDGMHIKKITDEFGDILIAPYMDGNGTYCDPSDYEDGEWMPLDSFGRLSLDDTDGYYYL